MPTLFGQTFTRAELCSHVGDVSQVFGVDLLEFQDGVERGIRVLRFRTGGGLDFDVLVDRAMDIAGMSYGGVPIGWHSPSGFKHPAYYDNEAENGAGWARMASGLMMTCGLDHIHAGVVEDGKHFNHPLKEHINHSLHGRIGLLPAHLKSYGIEWDGDECILYAEGKIRQSALFAENLSLTRRIEVRAGTKKVDIHDRVENMGFLDTPHVLLYHVNLGYPLLAEGTQLAAPIKKVIGTMHDHETDESAVTIAEGPTKNFKQRVFDLELEQNAPDRMRTALVNEKIVLPGGEEGLALELQFDPTTLPGFCEWQYYQSGAYVAAMEPATTRFGSREDWLERGEMVMLKNGEARNYQLSFIPHVGKNNISQLKKEISN